MLEYKLGNESVYNEIATMCVPYVRGIARKIINRQSTPMQQVDKEDLWQAGFVGLVDALYIYDANHPSKASFCTFAKMYVRREMFECIRNKRHIVTIPDKTHDQLARIAKVLSKPEAKRMSDAQVAKAAELTLKKYKLLKETDALKSQLALSPESTVKSKDETEVFQLGDRLRSDDDIEGALVENQLQLEMKTMVDQLTSQLDEASQRVIRALYGLPDGNPMKPAQLATKLGVPVEDVYEMKSRALRHLKSYARKKGCTLPKRTE